MSLRPPRVRSEALEKLLERVELCGPRAFAALAPHNLDRDDAPAQLDARRRTSRTARETKADLVLNLSRSSENKTMGLSLLC